MHNFKYHDTEDLEKLVENLKVEIEHLKKTTYYHTTMQTQALALSEDMLRHAEYEILERTLLK